MIHPLLHLIATKPHLLGEHLEAYAELVGAEVDKTKTRWLSRVALYGAAVFLLTVGVVLTGVALMLWAVIPPENIQLPWLLIVVPLAPVLASVYCLFQARAEPKYPAFDTLKQQFCADLALLRQVSPP